jgi:hypothetical protein
MHEYLNGYFWNKVSRAYTGFGVGVIIMKRFAHPCAHAGGCFPLCLPDLSNHNHIPLITKKKPPIQADRRPHFPLCILRPVPPATASLSSMPLRVVLGPQPFVATMLFQLVVMILSQ